jgi:hypothetical protein
MDADTVERLLSMYNTENWMNNTSKSIIQITVSF